MDFERNILKAMFFDYPVDHVIDLLDRKASNAFEDIYLDVLPQLVEWQAKEYTYTEANLLRVQLGGESRDKYLSSICHPLEMLKEASGKLLVMKEDMPVVRFDHLFRWKDIALHLGEDLFTTAFVASHDIENNHYPLRTDFSWRDIIKHNNTELNEILARGLADLHAHYYATTDVFNINWTSLMNHVHLKEKFDKMDRPQSIELLSSVSEHPSSLKQQCVAAAYLRFVLYAKLYNIPKGSNSVECDYARKVKSALRDKWYAEILERELQASISWALQSSMKTSNRRHIDYCLQPTKVSGDPMKDVFRLYAGERELMYRFFRGFYSKDGSCVKMAPYFYLYVLLKSKIRREFVQINPIKGFENFEQYQDRKEYCVEEGSPIVKYYPNNVFYSSINQRNNDYLEARVTPNHCNPKEYRHIHPLFGKNCDVQNETSRMGIVVHFIKYRDYSKFPTTVLNLGKMNDGTRDTKYRQKLRKQIDKVLHNNRNHDICGIDAASREIFCRPETFGHIYRYAQRKGIIGKTYHVGEDFLDIPDGLRAVDEAILFLELGEGCRIGHGMALGIDAKKYYERRHNTAILPKQNLLDDCVWMYIRAKELGITLPPAISEVLLETAMQMYHEIGYRIKWDIRHYWHSMLLRGNDPDYIYQKMPAFATLWEKTAILDHPRLAVAYADLIARDLFSDYFFNPSIRDKGMKMVRHKWSPEICNVVKKLQEMMRYEVYKAGVGIECCPTSNLKIGYIDAYELHPMLTYFHPVKEDSSYPLLKVSINTDDRGVFHTSIYEEYSLMALALLKKKKENSEEFEFNRQTVFDYIERIRVMSHQMAFRKYTDNK